jgi:pimeloyl-ACP methyl ester carboxylesterase
MRISVPSVAYRTVTVNGVNLFYRDAGPSDAPVILLLHEFPSSSRMSATLIPPLADRCRLEDIP